MLNKGQEQNVSEGSTAIQAEGPVTVIQTGLSYAEVRDVALDVFRDNFHKLGAVAAETANDRAEEITEAALLKLQIENPTGFEKAQDPDFQYSLFTVQREYARSGDKDLGDLLVDLLVDRSKHEQRDILQIVLNESLRTAPKLTESQLAALSLIFMFKYTEDYLVASLERLGEYLDRQVAPFASKVVKNLACYQHLEYCSCGSIGLGLNQLESILGNTYQGLFLKGFEEKEIDKRNLSIGADPRFFMRCINDVSRVQVNGLNKKNLEKIFDERAITSEDRTKISMLFDLGKMNDAEVRAKCIEIRPYMSELFETWSESAMKNFMLTSVGIAIGHANIKRLIGEFADLSIWIN